MFDIYEALSKSKVVLAPMAGYTSQGFRDYYSHYKIAFCYTEMVSDMGLIYGNKETFEYLPKKRNIVPTGLQLFGHDPHNIARAAQIALAYSKHIDFIDINMGCPVKKVCKTGAGSSLLKDPKLAGDIIKEVRKITNLPISAKIRLGYDSNSVNYLEIINELEEAGVSFIALHARTTKQLYSGLPQWEIIRDLRSKMRVPLLVSGNIFSLYDAQNALSITGADGVLVARGIIGNPTLIDEINNNQIVVYASEKERFLNKKQQCLELAQYMINDLGENKAMRIYRSIATKYFSGFPLNKKLNAELSLNISTLNDLKTIIETYERETFI